MPPRAVLDSLADTLIAATQANSAPSFSISVTASTVAWYAAFVASLSLLVAAGGLILSIHVARRDRPRIKVTAKANWRVSRTALGYDANKDYILIQARNAGRRPATITHAWLALRNGQSLAAADAFIRGPTVLDETNPPAQFLVEQEGVQMDQVEYVAVSDQAGRTWKGRFDPNPLKPSKTS